MGFWDVGKWSVECVFGFYWVWGGLGTAWFVYARQCEGLGGLGSGYSGRFFFWRRVGVRREDIGYVRVGTYFGIPTLLSAPAGFEGEGSGLFGEIALVRGTFGPIFLFLTFSLILLYSFSLVRLTDGSEADLDCGAFRPDLDY